MSKRPRILLSAILATLSLAATATAATMESQDIATGPVGLLTGALLCIVLTLLVWSDDLDRHSLRRAKARVTRGA